MRPRGWLHERGAHARKTGRQRAASGHAFLKTVKRLAAKPLPAPVSNDVCLRLPAGVARGRAGWAAGDLPPLQAHRGGGLLLWALSGSSRVSNGRQGSRGGRALHSSRRPASTRQPPAGCACPFISRCLQFAACLDVEMRQATCRRYRQVFERYAQSVTQLGNHEEGWQVRWVSAGCLCGPCAAAGKAAVCCNNVVGKS
jgi:hypothetical protein